MQRNYVIENAQIVSALKSPKIFILIVNYNGFEDTVNCLASLRKVHYPNFDILVIDNASTNDSIKEISRWLDSTSLPYTVFDGSSQFTIKHKVTLITSRNNLGFGGANNVGIKIALKQKVPFVLLLNNDTVVEPDFLDHMIETIRSSDRIGIVGGKIYHMSDKEKIWYCGGWIDYIRGCAYHVEKDLSGKIETTLVTGCLALLNLEAVKTVGIFDERFFLNIEDWDLSFRMRQAGWKLIVDTDAIIYHRISGSIGGPKSLRNQYYFHRNRLLFFYKHLHKIHKMFFFFSQAFIIIPLWILKELSRRNLTDIKAFTLGTYDFLSKHFGKSERV